MKLIIKNNTPKPVSIAITEELFGALGCGIASSSNDWGEVAISALVVVVDLSSVIPSLNLQREQSVYSKEKKKGRKEESGVLDNDKSEEREMLIFTSVAKTARELGKLGELQVLFAGKLPSPRKEEEEVGKLVSFQEYTRVWIEL